MNTNKDANRRDFLTGPWSNNAADPQLPEVVPRFLKPELSHLECYSRNAMACQFELMFNMHQYKKAAQVALSAFEQIEQFEEQMSIYRDSSEVSYINHHANQRAIEVDERLFELFSIAKSIYDLTEGAFDITSGPLSDLWGFSQKSGQVPDDVYIEATLNNVGFEHVELNDRHIRFLRSGTSLNLGAIGKGFALDHVAQDIEQSGVSDFIIHGGQSSVIARGRNLTINDDGAGWNVGLSHPLTPATRLAEIRLENLALGTSGTGRQGFFHQGKRYGHIIDPRTGYPTDHILSTTVICKSATRADALATGFFVMSLDQIQNICDHDLSIMAIVVTAESGSSKTTIDTFNIDQELLNIRTS